jgi:hypothetical protein
VNSFTAELAKVLAVIFYWFALFKSMTILKIALDFLRIQWYTKQQQSGQFVQTIRWFFQNDATADM